MNQKTEVYRLKRKDLFSSKYANLIASLFDNDQSGDRLRYSKWIFENNPALREEEELPIYVCSVDNEDAGQLAVIPAHTVFKGNVIRAGWCVDFFIKDEYQRKGIGKLLIEAAHKDFHLLMSLGQTDASFHLFHSKLGWHFNEHRLTLYRTILKPVLLFKFIAKKIGILKPIAPTFSPTKSECKPVGGALIPFDRFGEIPNALNHMENIEHNSSLVPRTVD